MWLNFCESRNDKKVNDWCLFVGILWNVPQITLDIKNKIKKMEKELKRIGIDILKLCCPFLVSFITHIVPVWNIVCFRQLGKFLTFCLKAETPTTFKHLRPINIFAIYVIIKIICLQLFFVKYLLGMWLHN